MTASEDDDEPVTELGRRVRAWLMLATPPPPRPLVRVTVTIEPRDIWAGVYIADGAVYLCPVPCLVVKFDRPGP